MTEFRTAAELADDRNGFGPRRVRFGVVNVLAAIVAVGTLGLMVFGPGACARPARYLFGWLVLFVSTLVAVAPLVDMLPDECFDEEEES